MRFHVEVVLPHPPAQVFGLLSDPRRRPEWQASLRRVELVDTGPPGLGTRWYDVTAVGLRPLLETTAWEPDVRWAERGRWRGVEVDLELTFTPLRDGVACRVSGVGAVSASGLTGPLVARVLSRLAPVAARSDLRRAGRVLDAR